MTTTETALDCSAIRPDRQRSPMIVKDVY